MADSIQTPIGAKPKEMDEFEIMRKRLQQRGAIRGAQAQRQGRRQAAALGNLPSGAAMRQQQIAQREVERQTSEDLQNVNIAEAQTREREREAQAGRDLQRFGIETQAKTAQTLQEMQGAQALERLDVTGAQALEQQRIAGVQAQDLQRLGAANDMEMARLQGATAQDLAKLQGDINLRAQQLQEQGVESRFATQMAENKRMFDIEQEFRKEGTSFERKMAEAGLNQAQQELAMNKSVTVLNSLQPLASLGFSENEIGPMLDALELPFGDAIKRQYAGMVGRQNVEQQLASTQQQLQSSRQLGGDFNNFGIEETNPA
jgi:hypothetical protein